MVALRKDVKLGLTLGGIVLSVVGVYVGLTALAGEKAVGGNEETAGATLVGSSGSDANAKRNDAGNATASARTGGTAGAAIPEPNRISGPRADGGSAGRTTPPAGPGAVSPTQPLNTTPGTAATSDDPWATAFNSGRINATVTQTPDPAGARTARTGTSPGNADPSDVIRELNKPGSTGATPSNTTPPAGNGATATADTSGSVTGGPTSATLTQTGSAQTGSAQTGSAGNTLAGNTQATSNNAKQSPALSPGDTEHTVGNGETLSSIAAEHYGNARYFALIIDANPQINPNRLKIGTKLRIPAMKANTAATTGTTASNTAGSASATAGSSIDPTKQYTVKANDSLHKIAAELYGDSTQWERIYNANKTLIGDSPARLKLGMVLTLPEPPTRR